MRHKEEDCEVVPLDLCVDIERPRKVEKTIKRSLSKSRFYLGADVKGDIYLRVGRGEDIVICNGMESVIKDLVELGAVVRYYDDKIDELYNERTFTDIEGYISDMMDMDERTRPVQDLFRAELSVLRDDVVYPKEKATSLIEGKASDFLLIQRVICNQVGVEIGDQTLGTRVGYSRLFQEMRNLANDIVSLEEDKRKGGVNILEFCIDYGIDLCFLKHELKTRVKDMKNITKSISEHPFKKLLKRNTLYWEGRVSGQYNQILDSTKKGLDRRRKEVFIMKQI